ncbi:hypothetical protein MNBD_GAMMA26-1900 [hydrothermal vent metagenome]|uniref:Uncharacterized protein n=1 Tax=hydrothermal vent metagenome TaxID=652676 RepID=A0A3B1BBL9_9ZZZZ
MNSSQMIKNKLFNNISWLVLDNIIRLFGGLLVGIWIARYLGPEKYGILSYAIAYTSLFIFCVRLGLDQIIVREIVKKPRITSYLLGTAFCMKFIGAVIAIMSICISLFFMDAAFQTKLIIIVICSGFVFQSLDVIACYYQSMYLSKYVVIARNCAFILCACLNVYLIIHKYSVVYFAVVNAAGSMFTALLLIIVYKQTGNTILQWKYSSKIALRILKYSWPLALSVFLISIHMKIDQVMIGSMLDKEQVGIYSVAVKLAEYWILFPGIIVSTLMPYFVSLRESDNQLYHYRLLQLYSLMFWMGMFVGIMTIFFGEEIISLLYGEAYVGSYDALVFNIWNGIFISQALARGIWMISENLQKYRLYNNVIVVIINISANLVLIPKLGIAGAALATLTTQALGTWVFSFLWKPLRESTWGMIRSVNPMYLLNYKGGA